MSFFKKSSELTIVITSKVQLNKLCTEKSWNPCERGEFKKRYLLSWIEWTFQLSVRRPWTRGELRYRAKVTYLTSLQIKGSASEIPFLQHLLVIISTVSICSWKQGFLLQGDLQFLGGMSEHDLHYCLVLEDKDRKESTLQYRRYHNLLSYLILPLLFPFLNKTSLGIREILCVFCASWKIIADKRQLVTKPWKGIKKGIIVTVTENKEEYSIKGIFLKFWNIKMFQFYTVVTYRLGQWWWLNNFR